MPYPKPSQAQPAVRTVHGPALPGLDDLDAATAATVAAIASPDATRDDVMRAAEAEQAVFTAFERRPFGPSVLLQGI